MRASLLTTPSSDISSPGSSHSSLTPTLQNVSLGRGRGRPWKQLVEPSYEGYLADGTKEEQEVVENESDRTVALHYFNEEQGSRIL